LTNNTINRVQSVDKLFHFLQIGSQSEYYLRLAELCKRASWHPLTALSSTAHTHVLTCVSGALAGLTEAMLTPFERVQAVLQMQQFHASYKHTLHVFQHIYATHGSKELYRGFTAICLRNSLSNAAFFGLRAPLKSAFPKPASRAENLLYDFANGGFLGASISTAFYPLNVVKSHMQARVGGEYYSMRQAFRLVYKARDHRLSFLSRGVVANFVRAIFAWGITNSTYELVLNMYRKKPQQHAAHDQRRSDENDNEAK
jgi:hypothetical protein